MSIKDLNVSLYNSKYLKYKNKYLTLKKMIGGGLTSSTVSINDMSTDILGNIIRIARNASQQIPALISSDFNLQNRLHEDQVDIWEYKSILKGFRIKYTEKHSISNVFDNKEYNVIDLTIKRRRDSSDDDLLAILNSLGNFNIIGNLCLRNNNITEIPQNFANIKVDGILDLRNNNIQVVPDNFSNIITDDVILDYKTERAFLSQDLQNLTSKSISKFSTSPGKIAFLETCSFCSHFCSGHESTFVRSVCFCSIHKTLLESTSKPIIKKYFLNLFLTSLNIA